MTTMKPCAWRSRRCDTIRPTDEYEVEVGGTGERRTARLVLCTFHGQAWPKVGEEPEVAEARTKRARMTLTTRENYEERRRKNKERAQRRGKSGAAGREATLAQRRALAGPIAKD